MEKYDIIEGRYQLLSILGEGGMASIWQARSLESDKIVAIKILNESKTGDFVAQTRLYREALAARAVSRSPHVVEIIEIMGSSDTKTGPMIVMEKLDGMDLRDLLRHEGRLSLERAVTLIEQLCHVLAESHGQGIIHRDLKPENIFVTWRPDGSESVKLFDFGVAKFLETPDGLPLSLDAEGISSCTPHYAAPEQIIMGGSEDHRADIYALGVLLFEMLIGRRPFRRKSIAEMKQDILCKAPPSPREMRLDIPAALEAIIMRALAKDPCDRFQAVDEMACALVAAKAMQTYKVFPVPLPQLPEQQSPCSSPAPQKAKPNRRPFVLTHTPRAASP